MKHILKRSFALLVTISLLCGILLSGGIMATSAATEIASSTKSNYSGNYKKELSEKADVRIMSYNVLADNSEGGFDWGPPLADRPDGVVSCIEYYAPDVVGVQEASWAWYGALREALPDYEFVNADCYDIKDNNCVALMYNTNVLTLEDNELIHYDASYWGPGRVRYINMALFTHKISGERFIVISTHFDAGQGEGYEECRISQANQLIAKVKEYARANGCPIISVGDYNCGVGEEPYEYLVSNGFTDADEDVTAGVIDHILFNDKAKAHYHATVNDDEVKDSSDHLPVYADIEFLEGVYYTPKAMERLIKTQGRTRFEGDTLMLDYSASGVEFRLNCKGDVFVTFDTQYLKDTSSYGGCYFTVVVDGVTSKRDAVWITKEGQTEVCIAEDLDLGNHTFAIYRQTELRGAEIGIAKFRVDGRFISKPKDNPLYIEFIGDSITCAYGNLGKDGVSVNVDSPLHQDATQGYAFTTAQALGADFSLVSYSGIGAKYGWNSFDMPVFYPAQAYPYDESEYGFERQPDIVVIALGTNDSANAPSQPERKKGFDELLAMVREKNPNAKIIWIYGMMTQDVNADIEAAVNDAGGKGNGCYLLKLPQNNSGAGWHPGLDGHKAFSEGLTKFIKETFIKTPVVRGVDDGEVIDLRSEKAPNLMWTIGNAKLNGKVIERPYKVEQVGEYTLVVENYTETVTVKFSVVDSSVMPTVSGIKNGASIDVYKEGAPVITWDVGKATLNGEDVESGITVSEEGEYELIVTDGTKSIEISFSVTDSTPPVKKGDPDGDGKITVADALAALRIAARLADADELSLLWGDIDADGEITVSDALAILRVAANMADGF